MSAPIDLSAYLARIGWTGPVSPTLEVLRRLAARHAATIPFENLDPFLGRPVRLDPASVEQKLVRDRRGGYCFEQNLLLSRALRAIGFTVTGLSARITWNRAAAERTPRSHMLLLVDVAGIDHVADVGFGGLTLAGALELVADRVQPTAHEDFRLLRHGGDWMMQARVRDAWVPVYRFNTEPQVAGDYEISNYWSSTHPSSHFTTGLMLARAEPGRRWALSNRRLVEHRTGGDSVRRALPSADAVIEAIETVFGITPPDRASLRARIETLPE